MENSIWQQVDDVLSEDIFPCPMCGGKHHDSKFISYEPEFDRQFICLNCGFSFTHYTWGNFWKERRIALV
jgi:transcription elongation factor Elf1